MRHHVRKAVEDTLQALKAAGALKLEAMPAFSVDPPKQESHGDFSVNAAMMLAKPEGKKPRDIAELIVKGLTSDAIAKVEIAGPGFLNFTLKDSVVQQTALEVLKLGDAYGRAHAKTGTRVMVEYVSANPTGPIHIGHARGTFVGDAIARLLDAAGHEVTREFYINDYGKQVETLGRTVYKRYQQTFGEKVELGPGEYPADYVIEIGKKLSARDGKKWLAAPESEWLPECISFGIEQNLEMIRASLEKAGVRHDVFSSEAALHHSGAVKGVVDVYKKRDATYEADEARNRKNTERNAESKAAQYADRQLGGTFLKTGEHGDDEDRIILRKDGTAVYLTADLAYHKSKFDRGFDRCIDVFGADHGGHVPRIRAGMRLLGIDDKRMEFVLVQIMRIVRNGEEVKVSKRKGTLFELDDLIEEVGADVCRFTFLMRTANAQFDFDLDAVTKRSSDNPVFYFQYGHARCAQILKKAAEAGTPFLGQVTTEQLATLTLPEERMLLKRISLLPDVVAGAADALEPHRVLYYCQELIAGFHQYYSKYKQTERVISDDAAKTQGRLAMVAALKQTLKAAFGILGVSAPEYMEAPPEEAEAK
ncbi:MAG: arginine--tRNA ligase [Archangiaceae bacterium]|nr:arginine--tRNA ligase [Archangiaceae bacterium]